MKLLIVIAQDQNINGILHQLTTNGFSVTKLASTGGFLKKGNTTLLVGVEEQLLDKALELIDGATVFTLDVERFERV